MSEEERVYTINLSRVVLTPKLRRSKRAISMIREFAQKHMKAEEVRIAEDLNKEIWERGTRHPPRSIRVKMVKDAEGVVTVEPYAEKTEESAKSVESKQEVKGETKATDNLNEKP